MQTLSDSLRVVYTTRDYLTGVTETDTRYYSEKPVSTFDILDDFVTLLFRGKHRVCNFEIYVNGRRLYREGENKIRALAEHIITSRGLDQKQPVSRQELFVMKNIIAQLRNAVR